MDERELRDRANELREYVVGVDDRERNADQRNAALIRVHEQGWKLLAGALERGLRDIAGAIRDHGR